MPSTRKKKIYIDGRTLRICLSYCYMPVLSLPCIDILKNHFGNLVSKITINFRHIPALKD